MPDLRAHLEVELRNGLIQGIHPRELARRFRKHYGGSVKDTERLMITEMRRLQTSVQKESFERNGYKDYQFISAGDERVCPECAKLHGQHFKVSEMRIGENAPPMHPSCHCSVAAWSDKEKYNRWIEALANGEDVRWNEFEAEDSDEDIYTIRRILDKRTEDKTRMSPRALKIFNTKPIVEQMKEINKLLDSYCSNPSLWSGKIIIDDSMSRWGKHDRKTHDITLRTDSPIKTKFHELIHTRTVFLNGVMEKETSIKFRPLNEAITEVVARGICKAEGIQVMNLSYPILVRNFRNIAFIMGIDELKLGLTLIDMPYENRYDWIKTMLEAMKNNNEISKEDYLEAKFCLEGLIKEI